MKNPRHNITLIGMAGVGKSTVGRLLADRLGYAFAQCDELITKLSDSAGVNKHALEDAEFMRLEEKAVSSLAGCDRTVIDTGGSVVYSEKAMKMLTDISAVIYLSDTPESIKERFERRGEPHLVGIKGKTFDQLSRERATLYERFADLTLDMSRMSTPEQAAEEILKLIGERTDRSSANRRKTDEYLRLTAKVSACLLRHDLMGISSKEHPDEYDPEAARIMPGLMRADSPTAVAAAVREVFAEQFGEYTSTLDFGPIAEALWNLRDP